MKKIIFTLIAVMLSILFVINASAETYLKGDVNMDGKVNASDARLVLRVGASLDKISETQKLICDMNDDGKITAADARTVLRISAKIEPGKGEIIIGETPSETVDKTELLSGIGMSIDDFMKKFGGMRELDTADNTISYTNDYVTVVSDPEMIHSGNISSINVTGGDYMLCGVYAGMPSANALSSLKADKWIVQQETSAQIILSKNGMCMKIAVADNTVTFVEYYLAFSLVNPDNSDTETQPSESTTKPSESTTKPSESTTKPSESTTTNEAYNNLPEQAKAYISGEFGLKGYSYNKDQRDPVEMYVSKNKVKAGMAMKMDDGSLLNTDVIIRDMNTKPKMFIACRETKMFCEVDSITMLLLNLKPDDLKLNADFVDLNKVKITQTSAKEGNTIYTVYNIKSDVDSCDIYMIGEDIKRVYNYDKSGILKNRIDIDEFYPSVSDSDFSLNNYKKGSLLEIFGLKGSIGDLL